MKRTYAFYYIPQPGQKAERASIDPVDSASEAREIRARMAKDEIRLAIHAGENHPLYLEFGEVLYLEPLRCRTSTPRPLQRS